MKVDFAPARRPIAALVAWAVICALLTVGLGIGAWRAWDRRQVSAAQAAADAEQITRLQATLRARADQAAAAAAPPSYARDALTVARTAVFPTQAVLRSLETVAVDGVRVTAIELNAVRGGADVSLEFDDYKALLAYLELLNEGESMQRWTLVRAEAAGMRRQAVIRSVW
ncbi:hypothetical protein CDN99_20130 [Roseateles aquatilis]|uniref:Uncharacterized protein n=1 Tax=Roseateles aquatilis TaxID=431061 RepID=A0A246J341_9BURK|nr:hypothetical protein CDN99_20130 [Roseateles aquatilis]